MSSRILVVTDDAVGPRMAGPAIRAWHIAAELARHGHRVTLASTLRATGDGDGFTVADGSGGALRPLATGQDVLVLQGYTLKHHPYLADTGARLLIDLYDPVHLELLEGGADLSEQQRTWVLSAGLDALRIQMRVGDFFVCATERQRDLWLGHLSAIGRINFHTYRDDVTLRRLIDVAPFGTDDRPPARTTGPGPLRSRPEIGADAQLLLWAGGVYNWFDPLTLIRAVAALRADFPRLRLVFMGTKHPSVEDLSTTVLRQAVELATELAVLDRQVFFLPGWVPYAERGSYLTDADIGVSTHFLHVETAYSFRTRMLDYLWAGLPIVCSQGDEFARLVAAHGLGAAVPTQDVTALTEALRRLLADPKALAEAASAVRELAPDYRWERTLAPIVTYCADPWPAADAGARRPGDRFGAAGALLDSRLDRLRIYRDPQARRRLVADGRWKSLVARAWGKAARPIRSAISGRRG